MANKRMVAKQIVDSDAFLDMPISSQLLYFHLIMRADDEGFVGNHKKIMREIGVGQDDFKILIAKRFLLNFESGVIVIKHWLMHNAIRMDRFNPTSYQDEKKLLEVKKNKAYTEWQPVGNQLAPQVKISQDKIEDLVANRDTPFSLKTEIEKLYDSPRRDLNIIGLYFEKRNPKFENKAQLNTALKRHLRAAKDLKDFTDNQLLDAIDYANKEYKSIYTLETLVKILTK